MPADFVDVQGFRAHLEIGVYIKNDREHRKYTRDYPIAGWHPVVKHHRQEDDHGGQRQQQEKRESTDD